MWQILIENFWWYGWKFWEGIHFFAKKKKKKIKSTCLFSHSSVLEFKYTIHCRDVAATL